MADDSSDETASTRRGWLRPATVSAVVLALAVAWLVWRTGGSPEPADTAAPSDTEAEAGPPEGLAVIDGRVIEPPFEVTAHDGQVSIGGVPLRPATTPVPTVADSDPQLTEEPAAVEVVEALADRLAAAGGPTAAGPSSDVVEQLVADALGSGVMVTAERRGPQLEMVDANGRPWSLLLQKQQQVGDEQPDRDEAGVLGSLLAEGGAVFAAGGTVISVPPGSSEFLDELAGAAESGADELVTLLHSQELADDLARPEASARLREYADAVTRQHDRATDQVGAPQVSGSALRTVAWRPPGQGNVSLAAQAASSANRTPTQPFAFLFTPLTIEGKYCWHEPILEAVLSQGYIAYHFDGYASTLSAFLASSGNAGVLYACMHGGNEYEVHPDHKSALAAYFTYLARGFPPEAIFTGRDAETGRWSIGTTLDLVRQYWTPSQTVIHMDSCGTSSLESTYRAREFAASRTTVCPTFSYRRNRAYWGRLAGTIDDGESRTVREAFDAAFDTGIWEMGGRGRGRTVLAPGVERVQLPARLQAPGTVRGTVEFDAAMAPSTDPLLLITIGPCAATVTSKSWLDDHTLSFELRLSSPGELIVAVNSNHAVSADEERLVLDGNRVPDGRNRVGPNRDDHTTLVECTGGVGSTDGQSSEPSPTTSDTATSSGPGIDVTLLAVGSKNETYLTGEGGRPVPGARVRITDDDGSEVASGTTDGDGRLSVDLPDGRYVVQWFEQPPYVYIEPGCDRTEVTVSRDGRAQAALYAYDQSDGPNDSSTEGYTYHCPRPPPDGG